MSRQLLGESINPPMFKVNGFELNEYELRQLQVRVKNGLVKAESLKGLDTYGVEFTFREDGIIRENLEGFSINTVFVMDLIRK